MTTRDLLTAYDTRFTAKFGHPAPIVPGKDGKIAASLLARYKPEDLERWLTAFFASHDGFICQSTYGLGVFQSVLGKLIAAERVRVETVDEGYRAARAHAEAEQEARLAAQREAERAEAERRLAVAAARAADEAAEREQVRKLFEADRARFRKGVA